MEKIIAPELTLPIFEIKKTTAIWKICLTLIAVSTILVITHSLIGNYGYASMCSLSYLGCIVPLFLLKEKKYKLAKYWLFYTYTFLIILSAFLIGEASFASFVIIVLPFSAMVFFKGKQRPEGFILMAVAGFLLCETITLYTTPIFEIAYPMVNKFISGMILISVTYLVLDLFKSKVVMKEADILQQNLQLKKEIRERKRITELLKEREERLQLAIEIAELGMYDKDLSTGKAFYSQKWWHILGYDTEAFHMDTNNFLALVHPEDRSYVENMRQNQLDGQMPNYEIGFRMQTKEKKTIWIRNVSKTVKANKAKQPLRIIDMFMDVTEQREAQIRLEKKNQKLKDFSSIASHDMREPLRTICSFSQVLKRFHGTQLDEDGKKYLGFIEAASLRMRTMLDDLLKYARVGVPEQSKKETCLNNVLSQVQNNLSLKIKETDAQITVTSLPRLYGHQTFFLQIFQNLLANALKFRKKDICPQIDITYKATANEHHFAIKDNGIGMEQSKANGIFKAFHRLHSRQEYEGTGLGLATCAELVGMMDGRIWVVSEKGVGSIFNIVLPKVNTKLKSLKADRNKVAGNHKLAELV